MPRDGIGYSGAWVCFKIIRVMDGYFDGREYEAIVASGFVIIVTREVIVGFFFMDSVTSRIFFYDAYNEHADGRLYTHKHVSRILPIFEALDSGSFSFMRLVKR